MSFDHFFTPCDYKPASSSRTTALEQFVQNIENQIDLFNGVDPKKVLSASGKPVTPTYLQARDGVVRVGIKYGGQYVKVFNGKTHAEVANEKFVAAMRWLKERAYAGDFNEQLEAIRAEFSKRFSKQEAGATTDA